MEIYILNDIKGLENGIKEELNKRVVDYKVVNNLQMLVDKKYQQLFYLLDNEKSKK